MNIPIDNSDKKRNFSKRDSSGTDPNRYANFSMEDGILIMQNPKVTRSLVPGLEANISSIERIIMVATGSYLLYSGLSGNKKNIMQSITGSALLLRGIAGYCPAYDAMGKGGKMKSTNVNIRTCITIDKPVEEVYRFWRNLENLPKFMQHLDAVVEKDKVTSHWTASGPGGIGKISWEAHILMDEKGKMLSWHSLPDSKIDNSGKVLFNDNGMGGTELNVAISYHAPLGIAGEAAAKLLNPFFERMVKSDIESLKTYLEIGSMEKPA